MAKWWHWACHWAEAGKSMEEHKLCTSRDVKGFLTFDEALAAGKQHCIETGHSERFLAIFSDDKSPYDEE